MPRLTGPAALVAVTAAALLLIGAGVELVDRLASLSPEARAEARAEELRDEIRELRPRLEDCVAEAERLEAAFRDQERRTEALRRRVEDFEAMDDRGVPSDRYDEYLEIFDRYNASLPEWERRAASAREASAACRALAEQHNARTDSLRDVLEDAGLWDTERFPPLDDPDR